MCKINCSGGCIDCDHQGERSQQVASEPVAWINKDNTYVELSTKSTVYGSHTIPLFTQGCATSCLQAPTIPAGMKLVNANGLAESMALFVPHEYYGEMDAMLSAAPKESLTTPAPQKEWDEKRMDIIGQNGNEGLHYGED